MAKGLIEYLPRELRDIKEFIALFSVLEAECEEMQGEVDRAYKNQFIKTADEEGISRLEKLYGITGKFSDSLDTRRFKLQTMSVGMLPSTEKKLREMLEYLCGDDGFEFLSSYNNFHVKIRVALEKKECFLDVLNLCRNVVPANMVVDLSLMYTQIQAISGYTHGYLSSYKHNEIKETIGF